MAMARLSAAYMLRTKMPWGDYGTRLAEGYIVEPFRRDGSLILHRTGPFMPPLTLPPASHIVTDAFRCRLAKRFSELRFVPVIKDKIVELHWEIWDRRAPDPVEYPFDMEPENYIEERPHSESAAREMGDLWEVDVPGRARGRWEEIKGTFHYRIYVQAATWTGSEWFRLGESSPAVVTESAREWLEAEAGDWIRFERLEIE